MGCFFRYFPATVVWFARVLELLDHFVQNYVCVCVSSKTCFRKVEVRQAVFRTGQEMYDIEPSDRHGNKRRKAFWEISISVTIVVITSW